MSLSKSVFSFKQFRELIVRIWIEVMFLRSINKDEKWFIFFCWIDRLIFVINKNSLRFTFVFLNFMNAIRDQSSFKIDSLLFYDVHRRASTSFYFFLESFFLFYGARKREEQTCKFITRAFQRDCKRSIGYLWDLLIQLWKKNIRTRYFACLFVRGWNLSLYKFRKLNRFI